MSAAWRTQGAMLIGVALVAVSAVITPPPVLLWNASASVPIGLYAARPIRGLNVGDLVVVRAPQPLASFLDRRGYLPLGVLLLKHVAALARARVCRAGRVITIDGVAQGEALVRDQRGRALPSWEGCRVLRRGEIFLMNRASKDSLDGRYFGPLSVTAIVGEAAPLWLPRER